MHARQARYRLSHIPRPQTLFLAISSTKDQVERDFEREYGKLQQLEEQTKRLQKDMKKSTDADLAMSKSAVKISLDLLSNPLCEQDQDFLNMVTALDTAMKRMDAFNQEKVNQIQKTVIEPLKKFGSVFPSLNMAVKRREQALQDYRRLQAKVEKYEEKEKTGPVLAKLHQAREELRPVRDDFEAKNKQLLDEMPRFYGSRLDYFQPSFESLIRAQISPGKVWFPLLLLHLWRRPKPWDQGHIASLQPWSWTEPFSAVDIPESHRLWFSPSCTTSSGKWVVYYSEMHKIFGDLTQQLDQPGHSDEQRERENEAKLSELRALSIVADD
nr:bridging integrator 3 isoform X3 [Marmota flaviventris]